MVTETVKLGGCAIIGPAQTCPPIFLEAVLLPTPSSYRGHCAPRLFGCAAAFRQAASHPSTRLRRACVTITSVGIVSLQSSWG